MGSEVKFLNELVDVILRSGNNGAGESSGQIFMDGEDNDKVVEGSGQSTDRYGLVDPLREGLGDSIV